MQLQSRISIGLHPLEASSTNLVTDESWLTNNSPALLDAVSLSMEAPKTASYQCASLELHCENDRVFTTTTQGEVELFNDDILQVGTQCYQITIQHNVSKLTSIEQTQALPIFSNDEDIWSSHEESLPTAPVSDPFVGSQLALPVSQHPNSLSKAGNLRHDPLDFLYQNNDVSARDPNALLPSKPIEQGKVLNDLVTVTPPLSNETDSGFLEQAPMDHLDQYLSFDDERYHLAAVATRHSDKPVKRN